MRSIIIQVKNIFILISRKISKCISLLSRRKTNVRGLDIIMDLRSSVDYKRAKTYSSKEPETLDWIDSFTSESKIIFYDIGANIGIYSLYAGKKHGKKIQTFAFEPLSQNISSLSNNIYINSLSGIIMPYCVAISEHSGFSKLHIPSNRFRSGGNRSQFSDNINDAGSIAGKTIIHSEGTFGVNLDDLCYKFDFPIPNYIKIDVDGIELNILKGAKNLLKDRRLKSLLIELGNLPKNEHDQGKNILEENGFELIIVGKKHNEIYSRS